MKFFLILMLTLSGLLANAQRADSVTRYYNAEHKITDTPQNARYFGIAVAKDSLWAESTYYYPILKLYSYGMFRDKELTSAVDSFYSFHITGELMTIGNYVNGKKDGIWMMYHRNGSLGDSANYSNGKPFGTRLSWHENGFPSDSTVWSETGGLSFSWNDDGKIQSVGPYTLDEKKQGTWKFYYPNGKLSSVEIYNNDELKVVKSFDENGNSIANDGTKSKLEMESVYPGGPLGWRSFLENNMKYPKAAIKKEIQGMVIVEFMVDEKGSLSKITAISGPTELKAEAVRLISTSGRWTPARYHGIIVKSYKRQPFVFRLEEY